MYQIIPDPSIAEQVEALPRAALVAYLELLATLEVAPWNGPPQSAANPEGAVRRWAFGPGLAGQVIYLVMDADREVHLLLVQWFGE
ncbi:hypothetical protein [Nocardia sp. NPDC056000]|uniref:hypothetical protein n=1 Tax=Nocardia sp. NPDC056000 TaxID=3345674 RepID=UPI0035D7D69D